MQRLDTAQADFDQRLEQLTAWQESLDRQVTESVAAIVADVAGRGDPAVLEYTARFDRLEAASVGQLEVSRQSLGKALERIEQKQREALEYAADRIRRYHGHQFQQSWQYHDEEGNLLGQQITPLERAGIYVPGGKASYPSSVLMNALPARVAGVDEIVMVVPAPGGEVNDLVLAAAAIAQVDRVTRSSGRAISMSPPPSAMSLGAWESTWWPARRKYW
jgi:histidinol dehydrogenase